jgi:hypothetical protein
MNNQPRRPAPAREVIAPRHESIFQIVGRGSAPPPLAYGEVRLWLVASGPHTLFAYWEFRPEEHPEALGTDGKARFFLRLVRDGAIESTVEVHPDARAWNLPAEVAEAPYTAEIGFFTPHKVWCFLARSSPARTMPEDEPRILKAVAPTAKPSATEGGTPRRERASRRRPRS